MENTSTLKPIRQGGMGFNISDWGLARAVSMRGQYGTVSGVALEIVMAEMLRRGDPGGHYRRALSHFPFPQIAEEVLAAFHVKDGVGDSSSFRSTPVWSITPSHLLISATICANYASVWLAKEGHDGEVGVNYLQKIELPQIPATLGAMLARVKFVTVGAGIPFGIPEVISAILEGRIVNYPVSVAGTNIREHMMSFDPQAFFGEKLPEMERPDFIPIISSNLLASVLTDERRMPKGSVQGFAVELDTAGGHNARPRKPVFNELGEQLPIYGPKDAVDWKKIADLGLPFWIGGSFASPEKLKWAQSVGAVGIQVGTLFALCEESGLRPDIRKKARKLAFEGKLPVRTDMRISPTGFPFKVAVLDGTISEQAVYEGRERVCNKGVLVTLYEKPDGSIGYRCPAEPVERYVAKGGDIKDTKGRGCICNGLIATAGLSDDEAPVVTLGDYVSSLRHLMKDENDSYTAPDAIAYLLGTPSQSPA
ncbi:MAG: nitronate monooxygenase [bacterium]|nr:nitronate monooxygenase [bacterium]